MTQSEFEIVTYFNTFLPFVDYLVIIVVELKACISLQKVLQSDFMEESALFSAQIITPETILSAI